MRNIIIFLAFFLVSAPTHAGSIEVDGEINESFYNKIIEHYDREKFDTIIISSHGGSEIYAMKIGKFVKDKNISIVINGVCMSSCSFFIIPAAKSVYIMSNSFISFHYSSYGFYLLYGKDDRYKFLINKMQSIIDATRDYIRYVDMRPEIFEKSMVSMTPTCFYRKDGYVYNIRMKANFWIPTYKQLIDMGFDLSGFWPENIDDASSIVKKWIKPEFTWRYGDINFQEEVKKYKNISDCQESNE